MLNTKPKLTLIGRSYCHLCDEMRDELLTCGGWPPFELCIIDIDADERLLRLYDELVPVLLTNEGDELCHYHLDSKAVYEYLRRFE